MVGAPYRSEGLRASRFNAELALEQTTTGTRRYATMTEMRQKATGGGAKGMAYR